jgi:hypothetical protein
MEMTRGEMMDLLAKFATEHPDYRKALLNNPKEIVARQFEITIPDHVDIRVVEDTADVVHVVLPYIVQAGEELSDSDLEAVAGGHTLVKNANCQGGTLSTSVVLEASLFG